MGPRTLLLGPNGQLGRDLQRVHAEAGEPFELRLLTRKELDLSKSKEVVKTLSDLDFDILVNCSAYNFVDEAEDAAAQAFAVNAHAVRGMAQACADKRARLVHVSTDYVFGGNIEISNPLREDDPVAPINVYGASKALGETFARLASDDVVILRVASLFGFAGAGGKGGNFVETIIRNGRVSKALRVVDDQTMSPTATTDVALVIYKIVTNSCSPGLYHVVNDGLATWFDFAQKIIYLAGIDTDVTPCSSKEYPVRAVRPEYSALDNAKAAASFGAMPPWQDALERYLIDRGHAPQLRRMAERRFRGSAPTASQKSSTP